MGLAEAGLAFAVRLQGQAMDLIRLSHGQSKGWIQGAIAIQAARAAARLTSQGGEIPGDHDLSIQAGASAPAEGGDLSVECSLEI